MMGAMAANVRFPEPTASGTGELRFAIDGLELVGTSVSALATAFAVDDLKTAVDMGRCSALLAAQQTVLLTHCHSDHVAGLVAWLSAHTWRHEGSPTQVVVPQDRSLVRTNLKAPIVINPSQRLAKQIILDRADYPVQYLLARGQQEPDGQQEAVHARSDS